MRPDTIRLKILKVLSVALFSLWSLSSAPLVAAPAKKCIKVYESTLYSRKPDMKQYGILTATTFNPLLWWDSHESRDRLTTSERLERWFQSRAVQDVLVLDLEQWPITGDDNTVRTTVSQMIELLRRIRRAGLKVPVGYYGVMPNRDYWRAIRGDYSNGYRAWQRENDRFQDLASEVDAIFPSLYAFYDDVDKWRVYAIENIREAKRLGQGKPVYPFLWPEFHDSNKKLAGQFVPKEFWKAELDTVAEHADGLVIWGGWKEGPRRWDDNASWWDATKLFMANQSVLCGSSKRRPMPARDLNVLH